MTDGKIRLDYEAIPGCNLPVPSRGATWVKYFPFVYSVKTVIFCAEQCDLQAYNRIVDDFMTFDPPPDGMHKTLNNLMIGFINYPERGGVPLIATRINSPENPRDNIPPIGADL